MDKKEEIFATDGDQVIYQPSKPHRAAEAGDATAAGPAALPAGGVAADEVDGVLDSRQPVAAGGGVVGGGLTTAKKRNETNETEQTKRNKQHPETPR